jgi:hypothetical protein
MRCGDELDHPLRQVPSWTSTVAPFLMSSGSFLTTTWALQVPLAAANKINAAASLVMGVLMSKGLPSAVRTIRGHAKVRSRHGSGHRPPTKERARCDFIELTAHPQRMICQKPLATIGTAMPIPRLNEMCAELHGRRLWNLTTCPVPTMTVAIYFGEFFFAIAVAVALLVISTLKSSIAAMLFCCGLVAWTLVEYITHRFVLHAIAPVEHGIHHARPQDAIDRIFWQIWLAFVVLYLMAGGAILAGALVAYAWYLFVHYCAHQNPAFLPASLLKHHRDHHRFANRNYGVTTTLWDRVFGTMLPRLDVSAARRINETRGSSNIRK